MASLGKRKVISEKEILEALKRFEKNLADGWSAQISMKNACGYATNLLAKTVRRHPKYLTLINNHMKQANYGFQFEHINGKLKPIKGPFNGK